MLTFKEQFAQGIIGDLENGRYGSAVDFATGITGHYMRSLAFNIPAAIPPTLPSPAQSGAPAPVGPAVPISTRTRERLFFNTIKTYYVGKEIASGRIQVRTLIEDANLAIRSYKKAVDRIRSIQQQIQDLDEKIVALQQDLKNVRPELRKFIQSKKNIIKSVIDEVNTIGDRFQQADPTFNFRALFEQELNDLLFFRNLKIEPSLNPLEIKATFVELINLYNRVIGIGRRYKNTFTKEANLRVYIAKKIQTAISEVMTLLNAFLSPEQYKSYWREFIFVPNGRRIATIILRIIDNNVFLKEKKKELYADLEKWKAEAQEKLTKKIDELQAKLEDRVETLKNNLILKNKRSKERIELGRKLKQTVVDIKNKIKQIRKTLKHLQLIYRGVIALAQNVLKIYVEIQNNIQKTKALVALIKEKYADIKTSIDESKSLEARQRIKQAREVFNENFSIENVVAIEDFGAEVSGALPVVSEILAAIEKTFQLSQGQIRAYVRIPNDSVQRHIKDVDQILTKDLPRLIQLFQLDPLDPNYDARLRAIENQTAVEGVATIVGLGDGENVHKGYLFLVSKLRKATQSIQELQLKVEAKIQGKKDELIEQSAEQDAVQDYISTFTETNPKVKKVKNKKREKENEIAEIKEKVYKLKKTAEYAKLAFRLLTDGYEIIKAVTTNPTRPISSSQTSLRRFILNYFKWQTMRGKITASDAELQRQQADIKIRDLGVYETLFAFLQDFIKAVKSAKDKGAKGLLQDFKEKLGEKWENLENSVKAQFEILLGIIDGDQPLTLKSLASISDALFYQTNAITALVRAQSARIRRFRRRLEQLPESIPQDTKDPFLLWIRKQLKKPNDIVLLFVRIVKTMFKKVTEFMEPLIQPIVDYIKEEIEEVKTKIQERAIERAEKKLESDINADAKVMSFMFNLAGKLYWLGTSWTSPVGTRYIVTSVGKFFPLMKANNVDGAEGIGREMAAGFDNQLRLMQGIAIPNPSYAIPPFPWTGYLPAPAPFPPSLPPTFDDSWSARFA